MFIIHASLDLLTYASRLPCLAFKHLLTFMKQLLIGQHLMSEKSLLLYSAKFVLISPTAV